MRRVIAISCLVVLLGVSGAIATVGATAPPDDVSLPPIEQGSSDQMWTTFNAWIESDGSARVRVTVRYVNDEEPLNESETPYGDSAKLNALTENLTSTVTRLERSADEQTSRDMTAAFENQRTYSSETSVRYRFNYEWENFAAVDGNRYVVDYPLAGNHSLFHSLTRTDVSPPRSGLYALSSISDSHENNELGGRLGAGVSDSVQFTDIDDLTGFQAVFVPANATTQTATATPPTATPGTETATATETERTPEETETSGLPLYWGFLALLAAAVAFLLVLRRGQ